MGHGVPGGDLWLRQGMGAHVGQLAAKDESIKSSIDLSNVACKPKRLGCCHQSLVCGQCLILLSLRPSSQRKGWVVMPRRVQQQQRGKPCICLLLPLLLLLSNI
jgi:hypothetical protein